MKANTGKDRLVLWIRKVKAGVVTAGCSFDNDALLLSLSVPLGKFTKKMCLSSLAVFVLTFGLFVK